MYKVIFKNIGENWYAVWYTVIRWDSMKVFMSLKNMNRALNEGLSKVQNVFVLT